jgi:hypothetical protein
MELSECGDIPCPVDCEWEEWSQWTQCDATCDGGLQMRFRNKTKALHNGRECIGSTSETRSCNTQECPNPCKPNPCYQKAKCTALSETEYTCPPCPRGMEGDGTKCTAVNECKHPTVTPCSISPPTHCIDLATGYFCFPCPLGYSGGGKRGFDLVDAASQQVCPPLSLYGMSTCHC